ncbi:MAG: DNA translocase FtsK [Candidatus Dadabacteria bacterium]|nr:MAG: DNA translocase FtsK [Candidatus Dadabacteria bacterium]
MAVSGTRRTASRSRKKTKKRPAKVDLSPARLHPWMQEIISVIFFAIGLFSLIAILSNRFGSDWTAAFASPAAHAGENLMGPAGHVLSTLLLGALGWCALVPVLGCFWVAGYFWRIREKPLEFSTGKGIWIALGVSGVLVFSASLAASVWGSHAGGNIGESIAEPLIRFFNRPGAVLFTAAMLILSLALATGTSTLVVAKVFGELLFRLLVFFALTLPAILFRVLVLVCELAVSLIRFAAGEFFALFPGRGPGSEESEKTLPAPKIRRRQTVSNVDGSADKEEEDYSHVVVRRRDSSSQKRPKKIKPVRKMPVVAEAAEDPFAGYCPPDISLLKAGEISVETEDDRELKKKSRQIEQKLRDFNIEGRVTHVHPGPVITLFEFEPAAGVKVGRIAALQDDLAMSLRASSIRIIAPIPGRGTVGIEVPNRHRDLVRLRDVLESEELAREESILAVPIGKDIYGNPVVTDIALMPHLLMAGATGTGKSVSINAILLSLLYRATPHELGLILIDPKILELSVYEGIPHLRVPVVTVAQQARAVLQWAVNEMNRRYRLMQKYGVRSIDGYNSVVAGDSPPPEQTIAAGEGVVELKPKDIVEEGTVEHEESKESEEPAFAEKLEPLPKIVIVIDELADLMLTVGRDIEELITRLAQKARAAGIHLIIATQRPSVDVITGLIKANFPARLSFRVSSRIDSRTILDSMGAEKLLDRGDMLFMQPGAQALQRVHGAFVSDIEVKRVVKALKESASPKYDQRIMELCEKALEEEEKGGRSAGEEISDEYDALYDRAVELVMQRGLASTSMLQRAFRIGYNRAARIIDTMEREGIIGPMDGSRPRQVLVANSGEEG